MKVITPFTNQQLTFIKENINADTFSLSLKKNQFKIENIEECILQIKARQKSKLKLPNYYENYDLIFPPPLSIEQSSSELTANYKSTLINKGEKFADLTAGFGIDFITISEKFINSYYIEQSQELFNLAKYNFNKLNIQNIELFNTTSKQFLLNTPHNFDLIYIDPARRDQNQKKVFLLEQSNPNILEILEIMKQKSKQIIIKLSPMTDITYLLNKIKNINEIHILSHKNECKEILLILNSKENQLHQNPIFKAVLLNKNIVQKFNIEDINKPISTNKPQKYIYLPDVSIKKLNVENSIALQFNLQKIDTQANIYTSEQYYKDYPGRIFELISQHKLGDKKLIRNINGQKYNIIRRNINSTPQQLKKKYKVQDGSENYLLFYPKQIIKMKLITNQI